MRSDDVGRILQIRQARERAAERALVQARQAEARAAAQRGRIDDALAQFAEQRRAREEAVSRSLASGPVTALQIRLAAAKLAAIAADGERLRQGAAQAARREAACAEITRDAERGFASASRDALGVTALQRELDTASRRAEARKADAQMEEAAGSRAPGRVPRMRE